MSAAIAVHTRDFSAAIQKITESSKFGDSLTDHDLGRIIGTGVVRGFRNNMLAKRDSRNVPWPQIQPRYGTEEGGQALRDRNLLFNSFSFTFNRSRVFAGTAVRYAALHNFGGRVVPKPPRKLLAIPLTRQIGRMYQGNFRALFPDAFVLHLGNVARRRDTLYLVRSLDVGAAKAAGEKRIRARGQVLKLNKERKLEFIARLVPYVDIPAREYLYVSAITRGVILQALFAKVRETWEGQSS